MFVARSLLRIWWSAGSLPAPLWRWGGSGVYELPARFQSARLARDRAVRVGLMRALPVVARGWQPALHRAADASGGVQTICVKVLAPFSKGPPYMQRRADGSFVVRPVRASWLDVSGRGGGDPDGSHYERGGWQPALHRAAGASVGAIGKPAHHTSAATWPGPIRTTASSPPDVGAGPIRARALEAPDTDTECACSPS